MNSGKWPTIARCGKLQLLADAGWTRNGTTSPDSVKPRGRFYVKSCPVMISPRASVSAKESRVVRRLAFQLRNGARASSLTGQLRTQDGQPASNHPTHHWHSHDQLKLLHRPRERPRFCCVHPSLVLTIDVSAGGNTSTTVSIMRVITSWYPLNLKYTQPMTQRRLAIYRICLTKIWREQREDQCEKETVCARGRVRHSSVAEYMNCQFPELPSQKKKNFTNTNQVHQAPKGLLRSLVSLTGAASFSFLLQSLLTIPSCC